MRNFIAGILVVICASYVLSPFDGMPGPVDDTVAIVLTATLSNGIRKKEESHKYLSMRDDDD